MPSGLTEGAGGFAGFVEKNGLSSIGLVLNFVKLDPSCSSLGTTGVGTFKATGSVGFGGSCTTGFSSTGTGLFSGLVSLAILKETLLVTVFLLALFSDGCFSSEGGMGCPVLFPGF